MAKGFSGKTPRVGSGKGMAGHIASQHRAAESEARGRQAKSLSDLSRSSGQRAQVPVRGVAGKSAHNVIKKGR